MDASQTSLDLAREWRNPANEAQHVVPEGYVARVLEPSPPAVAEGPWFADDPTDAGPNAAVGPTSAASRTWDDLVGSRPDMAGWAAQRWLGAFPRLERPPTDFGTSRLGLHRLALYVVSPARRRVNGKIALRWTLGGFGTPFFAADEQIRVAGAHLVRQKRATIASEPITTLRAAAAFALDAEPDLAWAAEFDVPDAGDVDANLDVDPVAAAWLGEWFGFAFSVLEEFRADPASTDASRVQLWVEHFDAAVECLDEAAGTRAGYGVSPGDDAHPEPYVYVVPWNADAVHDDPRWNATSFRGAILPLGAFVDAEDQRGAVLTFLRERRAMLAS